MKHAGIFYTLIAVVFLLAPQAVFAENISVNSTSNGTSTTCINGSCTTTGGDGHSTVCINGNCTDSASGNVDVQSDNGGIHIHTNTSSTTSPTSAPSDILKPTTKPSITPDPTIMQMRRDINNKVKAQANEVKKHVQQQENVLQKFFHQQMDAINHLWMNIFK